MLRRDDLDNSPVVATDLDKRTEEVIANLQSRSPLKLLGGASTTITNTNSYDRLTSEFIRQLEDPDLS